MDEDGNPEFMVCTGVYHPGHAARSNLLTKKRRNNRMDRSQAIGIDLGTTFCTVGVVDETGRPRIVNNRMGEPLTPSVIYFGGGEPLVGEEAKAMQGAGEEDVASFFKRSVGNPNYEVAFGGRSYTATDLSAILLKSLKADAEAELGAEVTEAVITAPAYFDDFQRNATIEAGKMAGLEVLRIIHEPTAAALAYGMHRKTGEQTVLVYDLGGGTFDVSLARITDKCIAVIGTDGEHELGGKDWDERVAMYLGQRFKEDHGLNPLDDAVAFNDLMVRCEEAKKRLSSMDSARISITHEGVKETYDLTRAEFEEMTQDLMERTRQLTEQVLAEQGMSWDSIDGVILVGGSTRMPMVREWVEGMSGKKTIVGVNVDEAVALGAAIEAGLAMAKRSGFTLPGIKERIDVMSHSLGMAAEAKDGSRYVNSIIIPKNKPIPFSATRNYELKTHERIENKFKVFMLQGESKFPLDCTVLGNYVFSGITHVSGKAAGINVAYSYDTNGVVNVEARENSTGRVLACTVDPVPDDLSWLDRPPELEEIVLEDQVSGNPEPRLSWPARKKKKSCLLGLSDATSSMDRLWNTTKQHIKEMISRVNEFGSFELKWVAYRDYCDGAGILESSDWHQSSEKLLRFIDSISCYGGGDFPEAVEKALEYAVNDKRATRVVLIGDAPPHSEGDYVEQAKKLAKQRKPVFSFVVGYSTEATETFKRISDITGGVSAPLTSANDLLDMVVLTMADEMGGKKSVEGYLNKYGISMSEEGRRYAKVLVSRILKEA